MKLYYAPESCAVAIWIALEWAGAAYEVENVELGSEEYMKIGNARCAALRNPISKGFNRGFQLKNDRHLRVSVFLYFFAEIKKDLSMLRRSFSDTRSNAYS